MTGTGTGTGAGAGAGAGARKAQAHTHTFSPEHFAEDLIHVTALGDLHYARIRQHTHTCAYVRIREHT
jgi:hypothetical protein